MAEGVEVRSSGSRTFRLLSARTVAGPLTHEDCLVQAALETTCEENLVAGYRRRLWLVLGAGLIWMVFLFPQHLHPVATGQFNLTRRSESVPVPIGEQGAELVRLTVFLRAVRPWMFADSNHREVVRRPPPHQEIPQRPFRFGILNANLPEVSFLRAMMSWTDELKRPLELSTPVLQSRPHVRCRPPENFIGRTTKPMVGEVARAQHHWINSLDSASLHDVMPNLSSIMDASVNTGDSVLDEHILRPNAYLNWLSYEPNLVFIQQQFWFPTAEPGLPNAVVDGLPTRCAPGMGAQGHHQMFCLVAARAVVRRRNEHGFKC